MKKPLPALILATVTLCFASRLSADGYLVPNGVTYAGSNPGATIHVIQDPATLDYTGFILLPQSISSFQFSPFLDEGVRTFLVSFNDPVSESAILAGAYPELLSLSTYTFANSSTFYLGFYTGDTFPQDGVYGDPLFGWGRFRNNSGTIQLLDGELAYQSGGILAGTQTLLPIPEPSSVILVLAGVCMIGVFDWRRRSRDSFPAHTANR